MGWMWVYYDADGLPVQELPQDAATNEFPTQADAEAYIGSSWKSLLEHGIDEVSLFEGDRHVYGPMSLHPA